MSTEPWRVAPLDIGPPRLLLARGAELLENLAHDPAPTLRWYRSTTTAVVLGRGQAVPRAPMNGVDLLSRSSGGGAVLLTPDMLSLDVVLPTGHPLLAGDLSSVFLPIGRAWRDALNDLGLLDLTIHEGAGTATRRGTAREQLLAAICYATLGRGEVLAGGRKLVGLSQRRRRQGALIQCGLLRRWEPGPLLEALTADPDDDEIARAAVGLDDLIDPPPSDDRIIAGVSRRLTGETHNA